MKLLVGRFDPSAAGHTVFSHAKINFIPQHKKGPVCLFTLSIPHSVTTNPKKAITEAPKNEKVDPVSTAQLQSSSCALAQTQKSYAY